MFIVMQVNETLSGTSYNIPAHKSGIRAPYPGLSYACDGLVELENRCPTVQHNTWSTEYGIYQLTEFDCDCAIQEARKRVKPAPEDPVPHEIYKDLLEHLCDALERIRELEQRLEHIIEAVESDL